jgi:hypothetical protein
LHEAAFHNSTACVQVLLDCGAPLRPRTDQGKTPLDLAEEVKSDESIALLRDYKVPAGQSRRADWLHDQSSFDRVAAKQLIESVKNGPQNGLFVVRRSSKNSKNFALTLYNENEFFNYEIIRYNEFTWYIDDGPYFDSLEHLIDHYCRIPDGLPATLTCSLNRFGQTMYSRVQPFVSLLTHNSNMNRKKGRQTSIFVSTEGRTDRSRHVKCYEKQSTSEAKQRRNDEPSTAHTSRESQSSSDIFIELKRFSNVIEFVIVTFPSVINTRRSAVDIIVKCILSEY